MKPKDSESLGQGVFTKTADDERPGLSIEDRAFLEITDKHFCKEKGGNWTCPLPFRSPRPKLTNNYLGVLKRAKTLERSMSKDPEKKRHFMEFMTKLFENGHAEEAPPIEQGDECWYIPIFGVYHPRKRDQIRVVFDSAAKYGGLSLNDILLSGPDLCNSLLGILLRFRREPVAVMADIQQRCYCFRVNKEHRDFLRFFWHKDNDFDKPLVEHRMCVHVFGNTSSPAIAAYGLRKSAAIDSDVLDFVSNDFYVDDGLLSLSTVDQAVSLIKRTQEVLLSEGNLRLHKIASNSEEVMCAFPSEQLAKDLKDLDLGTDTLPTQRSLGVAWDLFSDSFTFSISPEPQPYTRRGLLSTVNSIFDPLGFVAPVVIKGKLLLRTLVNGTIDWDAPLPEEQCDHWVQWRDSLSSLCELKIQRVYLSTSFSDCKKKSVHIFSDASELAIAAVGYLKAEDKQEVGFILGKTKVAPSKGHTIPRLELCAAVLAVEMATTISQQLKLPLNQFNLYTDSKVVLGYIHNESRIFHTYVSNRVQRIRSCTSADQWSYVRTGNNPADQGTRSISASQMPESMWITGPHLLLTQTVSNTETYEIQNPDDDKELRSDVTTFKTDVGDPCETALGTHRFTRFSSWKYLVETIARLRLFVRNRCWKSSSNTNNCSDHKTVQEFTDSENHILKEVQKEAYHEEIEYLRESKPVPRTSPISSLSPYIDEIGIVRVGGRLKNCSLTFLERNPVLIPGKNHIAILIIRHYHDRIQHQDRHITAGAVRSAGFWITGAKRLISSIISKSVKCRKLRASLSFQKMANLPTERLEPSPPFTNVGVDCFGPWLVTTRRTRGGQANSKRWAALFTCLSTRAIHIEVLEELSASSFINALKRFISVRGPVKQIRSDQGTNFIGATSELNIDSISNRESNIRDFLYNNGCTWVFNPPHTSHMGGIWERMIGVTRRILDSLLMNVPGNGLTHEVLTTFLAEASAIVNSRPLVSVSSDPEDPFLLSPSLLLTQKAESPVAPLNLSVKDMYKSQWKRVQLLVDSFWSRWRTQYLQTLQSRRKWKTNQRNFVPGDVVLLRDKQTHRNSWPLGIITKTFPGDDNLVRSVELRVIQDGNRVATFNRPVTELVLLLQENHE